MDGVSRTDFPPYVGWCVPNCDHGHPTRVPQTHVVRMYGRTGNQSTVCGYRDTNTHRFTEALRSGRTVGSRVKEVPDLQEGSLK